MRSGMSLVLFAGWLLSGSYTYGTCVALFHHDFKRTWAEDNGRHHRGTCIVVSTLSPPSSFFFAAISGLNAYGYEL